MKQLTKGFTRCFIRVAAAAALVAAFGFHASTRAQDAASGDAVNGKRVYLADGCFECHGRAGQGGTFNYPAPVLAQLQWPVEAFVAYLRGAPNDMPTYSATVLSDKDAADIHAFLRSLPGRKSPAEIPLIESMR